VGDRKGQGVAGGEGPSAARLENLVGKLRGVSGVEVSIRDDGSPHFRVWLDGSASSEEVGDEIQRILAAVDPIAEPKSPERVRRSGLGRSLGELLEANGDSTPLLLHPQGSAARPASMRRLLLVAIEETAGGVSVRVADSDRGVAFAPVEEPDSLNEAVAAAVGQLHEFRPVPKLEAVEVRELAGQSVLTVLLRLEDGRTLVGSELILGGFPFTLGQAVWKALTLAT
jgi:hypothetical protein